MHRKRTLKSPFVVTAASVASASMIACAGGPTDTSGTTSGAVVGSGPVTSNPPAPVGQPQPTPRVATPEPHVTVTTLPDCPAATPLAGSTCTPSQSCQYDRGGCPVIMKCEASTSTWQNQSPPCNPPPPTCPSTMPSLGTPCDGDLSCSYEAKNSPCPSPQVYCDQNSKTWQAMAVSCNPPPPFCPTEMPAGGSPCYGTLECDYPNGTGCPGPTAVCNQDTGTWLIAIATCNPPPPQQ